jgi:hypothetical protein
MPINATPEDRNGLEKIHSKGDVGTTIDRSGWGRTKDLGKVVAKVSLPFSVKERR